ncbi:MAG: hypothetical protein M8350_09145 [Methanosarcinaceae archaeon]|nr:hypothetical protein [Methanosarcinaceae archaeon]
MHRKSKFIAIMLALGLFIIATEPVYADNNHTELMDFSLITDLNQTVGKDALSLVDESRLDILGSPHLYFFWSPDGTRMLVVALIGVNTKGKGDSSATLGKVLALYMVNGDGSDIRRISWVEDTSYTLQRGEHKWIQNPTWSHTGNVFLYTERSGGNARFGGGSHSLFVIDAKNLNLIAKKSLPIKQGPILEWSPKEDSLLYLGLDEQYKPTVFLFNLTKNVSDELPISKYRTAPFNSNDLVWSPDGRKIGFEGNGGLYVLDVDTRKVKNLFSTDDNIIIDRNAFWSLDSSRLIITEIKSTGRADNPIYYKYVIDAISGKSNKLTSFESVADYLMNKEGSNKDELLLIVNENQSNALAIINASTKQIRQIPLPGPYIDKVSWSPTGRYLIARTFKPKTSKPDGYPDYEYQDYLMELPEYDRPMRMEIDGHMLVGTNVNISIKSASGGVDNATIMAGGELIGTTNEKGVITHRFNEKGEVQLRAVKDGYSAANRIITVKDHIDERQDPTSTGTTTASVPDADGTGVPGFTATAALVGLISTILCFQLKSKRK